MMKISSFKQKLIFISLGLAIICIYFSRLFFPVPSLFSTPDFGRSDLWHQNIPLRYSYSESLQKNELPLWDQRIGNGFPVFAENQIGGLNLQNLILFRFLPFVTAFNLSYIFIFFTSFIGCFLLFNEFRINPFLSFTGALIFAFSGFFIVHIPHVNLIHAASYLPLLFFLLEKWTKTKNLSFLSLFIFFETQCFLAGSPQFFLIINLFFFLYLILMKNIKNLMLFMILLTVSLVFCLPQIIPSYHFFAQTARSGGEQISELSSYPFSPKNLISFLNPFTFGNPKIGNYPMYSNSWGVFWESTFYIGIFTFIIYLSGIFFKKNHKSSSVLKSGIFFLLLGLGKYTPFFIILQILPFSLFRVPSRFLYLFMFSIIFIAITTLNKIINRINKQNYKKIFQLSFFILVIPELLIIFYNYNLILPARIIFSKPKTTSYINSNDLVYSFGSHFNWNKIFAKNGWNTMAQVNKYQFLNNQVDSNMNIFWKINNFDVYAWGFINNFETIRNQILLKTLNSRTNKKYNSISLRTKDFNIFEKYGINVLISPVKIQGNKISKTIKLTNDNLNIYIVRLNFKSFKIKIPKKIKVSKTITETDILNINSNTSIIQGKNERTTNNNQICNSLKILQKNNIFHLLGKCKTKTLVVINSTYYPDNIFLHNNQPLTFFPVNLSQTGVWIED
jgi:hypothetical protein